MKKIIIFLVVISLGILITFFFLNQEKIYDQNDYIVYALEVSAYKEFDDASNILDNLPSGIMIYENDKYKLYTAIYEDIDLVNRMITFLAQNDIKVYLDAIKVDNNFYRDLIDYEKLIRKTTDDKLYNNLNQSILNSYVKSVQNV